MLNLPAITVRNAHERPEGMDVGTLIMIGLKKDTVLESIKVISEQHDRIKRIIPPINDYENAAASKQILRVVMSYVDYVKRTVWKIDV